MLWRSRQIGNREMVLAVTVAPNWLAVMRDALETLPRSLLLSLAKVVQRFWCRGLGILALRRRLRAASKHTALATSSVSTPGSRCTPSWIRSKMRCGLLAAPCPLGCQSS